MPSKFIPAIALATALVAVGPVVAAPITFDEAIDGDLPGFPKPATAARVLDLGIGINLVSGSVTWTYDAPGVVADWDNLAFRIPLGTTLTAIGLSIAQLPVSTGLVQSVSFLLLDATLVPTAPLIEDTVRFPPADKTLFAAELPLAPGLYGLQQSTIGGLLERGQFASAGYTFQFSVVPVPEPASLGLLAVGLATLAAWRRPKPPGRPT